MNLKRIACLGLALTALLNLCSCGTRPEPAARLEVGRSSVALSTAQVPDWTKDDLDFFLHGSMSTEVVPETLMRAFIEAYPDLFPSADLSNLGLIPDPAFGWPIGLSRKPVSHLGGLPSLGLNCAGCHVGRVTSARNGQTVTVLGMTSLFDAEGYFGGVIVATFRSADTGNLKKVLTAYLAANDPKTGEQAKHLFTAEWDKQEKKIAGTIAADPAGANGLPPGALHKITASELRLDAQSLAAGQDLAALSHSLLKAFHNIRAALHVPDQPPEKAPPSSGPGRNDAFGLLSASLFAAPQSYAPVKYGLVWSVDQRHWVHWDGNTQSPIGRNLLAALGLGAPLSGHQGQLEFALVKRQTDLSERIHPPKYPFAIDQAAASRGAAHYQAHCASCHDGPEDDHRLHAVSEIGTDPRRAELFNPASAERFNKFLAELETPGYQPGQTPGIRSTQKYWAVSMAGVWARSPYLHNGSVRTMAELLTPAAARSKNFHRGSRLYDETNLGYTDAGSYLLDTTADGNSNSGHEFGATLSTSEKREIIEYLKTL